MKAGGHESETKQAEITDKDDSNRRSPKIKLRTGESKTSIPRFSPYIAEIARDFSRELGDSEHEASNMKQALNLWQGSGLDEQHFVEVMHEARKLTRRHQSRPSWDAMNNRMAYFYATLRDLLGLDKTR
jgi:hypothetical protein